MQNLFIPLSSLPYLFSGLCSNSVVEFHCTPLFSQGCSHLWVVVKSWFCKKNDGRHFFSHVGRLTCGPMPTWLTGFLIIHLQLLSVTAKLLHRQQARLCKTGGWHIHWSILGHLLGTFCWESFSTCLGFIGPRKACNLKNSFLFPRWKEKHGAGSSIKE